MLTIIKNKSTKTIIALLFCIFSLFCLSTIAYSAFSSTMNITGMAKSRVEADVRITDFSIHEVSNATSSYEEFSKNTISSSISLNENSYVIYKVEVTNYSEGNVGIYEITGLPEGISYELIDYVLKDKLCDNSGKCSNFAVKTFYIKLIGNNISNEFTLNFDFRIFHTITYQNLSGEYQTEIIDGNTIDIDMTFDAPKFIEIESSKTIDYVYSSNILTLKNITADITIKPVTTEYNYDYTGSVQTITIPHTGTYKLETWGAQGGNYNSGYGAYSTGIVKLEKGDILYLYVGGQGGQNNDYIGGTAGYNGGGKGGNGYVNPSSGKTYVGGAGGGGATHIATVEGQLSVLADKISNILIVSGGGGGNTGWYSDIAIGGSGGGKQGQDGTTHSAVAISAGTQNTGNLFGKGADGVQKTQTEPSADCGLEGSGGGGGGFYGGATSGIGVSSNAGGGGGSGYIANSLLSNKYMVCKRCGISEEESTKTLETTCTSKQATSECAKEGNGYIKISLIEYEAIHEITYTGIFEDYQKSIKDGETLTIDFSQNIPKNIDVFINGQYTNNYTYVDNKLTIPNVTTNVEIKATTYFDYSGSPQMMKISTTGIYQIEAWGAQGGESKETAENSTGGYGGYSTGEITLSTNQNLYIYVGGKGEACNGNLGGKGGYNGGGSGGNGATDTGTIYIGGCGGGGATHVSTKDDILSNLSSNISDILMVSGGGGGGICWNHAIAKTTSGSGGGFAGGSSKTYNETLIAGGNQISGYLFGQGAPAAHKTYASNGAEGNGGGGGGFYGGIASGLGTGYNSGGSGGSGYIGNSQLTNKHMTCYKCDTSTEENTKTINTTCSSEIPKPDCTKIGNGFVKITLIKKL